MKTKIFYVAALAILLLSTTLVVYAQNASQTSTIKTEAIKVSGNCETCKARIEKAARIPGVSKADWNIKTKVLTLVYNPSKVKSEEVQKKIAAVGHDAGKFKADAKVYNALPGCCKYR
ncbi:MAG: heavy-metal-associated domain-containing protein [Bacteroidales bacterium]|nr:heavy-metal-associated domain-containing protein [Bacteroidales bacterium]